MPTNIISGLADPVGGNAWSTVGGGLQGLAGLVGGIMSARAADQAANVAKGQGALSDAGYKPPTTADMQMPGIATSLSPQTLAGIGGAPRASSSVDVNASVPPIQMAMPALATSLSQPRMAGGGGAGFQSIFASRFPSLFPQSNMQYGGL